jgi:hypothetical protein
VQETIKIFSPDLTLTVAQMNQIKDSFLVKILVESQSICQDQHKITSIVLQNRRDRFSNQIRMKNRSIGGK